jgi:ATP-dependent helicase/DNAse subunit B
MLFHCPYRFLLHGFRIDSRELPTSEADSLVLGKWLHRVFQLFFQGITDPGVLLTQENEDLREPWTTAITTQQYDAALHRLQRLGKLLMSSHDGQEHLFYHMLYVGWPAFIKQEILRGPGIFRPEYFEFDIEDFLKAPVQVGSHSAGARGRVDRIFATENDPAQAGRLIDYKLSGFRGSQQSVLDADEPQLPLYAFALQATGLFPLRTKWTGEYWSIRHGESKTVLEKEGLSAAFGNLANRWQQRLNQLNSGAPFDAEVTKYCEQCAYAGVCRREELHYTERFQE